MADITSEDFAELQEQKCKQRSEHYLDFYKKYDSEPTNPEIELGEIRYSWCLVFALEVENVELGAALGGKDTASCASTKRLPCQLLVCL